MLKPLRFNALLKAVPGLAHLRLTPQAAHHTKKREHVHIDEDIEVRRLKAVPEGIKETRVHEKIKQDVKINTKKERASTEVHEHISTDIHIKKSEQIHGVGSETLEHVHATIEEVAQIEMTPPHPPREETPIYQKTHRHLVYTLDTPCAICGVRNSTLQNSRENPFGAQSLETHHYPIERSLMDACDPKRIHLLFPQVKDHASLEEFIDSEENMMVLCDVHHRHPHYGIHHLLAQDFFIQPYLLNGYQIVAETEEVNKIMAANERVISRHAQRTETTHKSSAH